MPNAKVLIVDDEPAYRETLRLLVPAEGYDVETAATGQEAFDIARRFPPDVLVIDWMLNHHTNGLEVAEKLFAAHPEMRVILISSYPTASLKARVESLPWVEFLSKPFTLNDLVQTLRKVLAKTP